MDAYPRKQSNRPVLLAVLATSLAFLFLWTVLTPTQAPTVTKAVAILKGDSAVTGTVTFEQTSKGGPVKVTGELHNLDPLTKRGFHIHQYGDATDGCASSGSHFNPYSKNHGAPTDKDRHVGDLGNIETDEFGVASIYIQDSKISLNGETSIIGRSVVVHSGVDDLGRGDNEESLKTGNAGGRAACGVIGLA